MKEIINISKHFFPKPTFIFTESVPCDETVVFVANHEKNYGPGMMQLFFPIKYRPWIIYNMLNTNDCTPYIQQYFFSDRLGWPVWLSNILSNAIASSLVRLMHSTNPVPVYRGRPDRIIETFRQSIRALRDGDNLLIFPEDPNAGNFSPDVKEFFEGFLYLAKIYHRETENNLLFYPVSINPKEHIISIGKPIRYRPEVDFSEESERIKIHLMRQITLLYHHPWLGGNKPEIQHKSENVLELDSSLI